jgi:hypothetical protein
MKGRLLVTLFALPFFGIGVWMLFSIGSTVYDAVRMEGWVAVEAHLTRAGYETSAGEDSDTYQAFAEYTYTYAGLSYRGDRVAITKGGDNIGDFQRRLGIRLENALRAGEPITVYVNPDDPAESIVYRTLRWGLVGFKSIFVFVFGGVGLGLLIFTWRATKEKDRTLPLYQDQPWLLNDAWQTPEIRSDSKTSMYGAWLFAAFWNLISAPLPFLLYPEIVEKENYIALIGLLFPLVGISLLYWAITRTREWRRFGAAPLTLDPFPGSIGGHVGGTIDLNLPFDPSLSFELTLTSILSHMSGSGDDRSRSEKAKWQDALVARAEPGPRGTRLVFRFDVPAGLPEADAEQDDSYHLWRLNLQAETSGTDLDRSYEIPVYATAQRSRLLSDRAVAEARAAQNAVDEASVRKVFEMHFGAGGRRFVYPMGRHLSASIGGLLAGLMFAGAAWWLMFQEEMPVFGGVLGLVGGLIALAGLYMMLNSLEVRLLGNDIVTIRRVLGIPVRRRSIARHRFRRFDTVSSFQTQSGGKHVVFYKALAVDESGRSITVGEGFRGRSEARAAIEIIGREFGLQPPARQDRDEDALFGPEVLT